MKSLRPILQTLESNAASTDSAWQRLRRKFMGEDSEVLYVNGAATATPTSATNNGTSATDMNAKQTDTTQKNATPAAGDAAPNASTSEVTRMHKRSHTTSQDAAVTPASPSTPSARQPAAPATPTYQVTLPANLGMTPATRVISSYRPLFFSDLTALNTEVHRHLALPPQRNHYPFAASAYFLPLTISEVLAAVLHYPLIFVPEGDVITLMVLTGVPLTGNRFLEADGRWREGVYVPAYVRGYPFITVQPAIDTQPIIAFDPNAADFKAAGGEPLLDAEGRPSERFQNIIAFHGEYRTQVALTRQLTQALKDAEVLEPSHLQARNAAGEEVPQLDGFLVVNEAKLAALPADKLKHLAGIGALGLAYHQIVSMGNLHHIQPPAGMTPAAGGSTVVTTSTSMSTSAADPH